MALLEATAVARTKSDRKQDSWRDFQSGAWCNSIDVRDFSGANNAWNVQIAVFNAGGSNADSLVGKLHVQGIPVRLGEYGDGLYPQFLAGANNTQGDLAPIRYQNLLEHFLRPESGLSSALSRTASAQIRRVARSPRKRQ